MEFDKVDPEEIIKKLERTLERVQRKKINIQLNDKQEVKMVKELPKFKGYTVDERLRQFRKVDKSKPSIDFVNFDSDEGEKLLEEYESLENEG